MWANELWSACIASAQSIVGNTVRTKIIIFLTKEKCWIFLGLPCRILVPKGFNYEKAFGGSLQNSSSTISCNYPLMTPNYSELRSMFKWILLTKHTHIFEKLEHIHVWGLICLVFGQCLELLGILVLLKVKQWDPWDPWPKSGDSRIRIDSSIKILVMPSFLNRHKAPDWKLNLSLARERNLTGSFFQPSIWWT